MEKLKLHTPDLTDQNIDKIGALFPNCLTEAGAEDGTLKRAIDFDLLKQELSKSIVEGPQERYQLNWPGKREALLTANAPIAKTLRPVREESVNFDTTRNLFIEGDNLDALKLLQETYLGKINLIYIDPPYNTGKDFIYEDDFAETTDEYFRKSTQKDEEGNKLVANTESNGRFHSDWLSMMYSRLKIARSILSDKGVIVVHMDENEIDNLEKLLTEIFGEHNKLGVIVWDKRNPKGDSRGISNQHENLSLFSRNKEMLLSQNLIVRKKENAERILGMAKKLINDGRNNLNVVRKEFKSWLTKQPFSEGEKAYSNIDDDGNVYRTVSMAWPNKKKAPKEYFTPLVHPVTGKECPIPGRGWRNPPTTMKTLLERKEIIFGIDETTQPQRKYLLSENIYEKVPSIIYFAGSDDDLLIGMGIPFETPKPIDIGKMLINPFVDSNGIILDFFAGSSTTAHSVLQLNAEDGGNRQFIMVQLPEPCDEKSDAFQAGYKTIAEISKERIRRAGKKILEDNAGKEGIENLDVGFRVLKIDTSTMADVYYKPQATTQTTLDLVTDNIKPDRSPEDLLFHVLLDWGVDLTLPIRKEILTVNATSFEVFFVDDNALAACFAKSGEINDEFCTALAAHHPLRVVFRDSGFKNDAAKINADQIFKLLSPQTDVRCI